MVYRQSKSMEEQIAKDRARKLAYAKQYYEKNKDKIKKKNLERYKKTREKRLAKMAEYYQSNSSKLKKKATERARKRYQTDAKYRKKSNTMRQLDRIYSIYIRKRDGVCVKCGTMDNLQCSHILPRTYQSVRWHPDNAIALCVKHHIYWWHKYPHEAVEWFDSIYPGRYSKMRALAHNGAKVDRQATLDMLNQLIKDLPQKPIDI